MTGLTWEAGFEAGWEACEKHSMQEHETFLTERNAARNEVDRLKSELSGFRKAAENRKAVIDAIKADSGDDSWQEKKKEAEAAIRERRVLEAQLDAARIEINNLKGELRMYQDAAENRKAVIAAVNNRDEG